MLSTRFKLLSLASHTLQPIKITTRNFRSFPSSLNKNKGSLFGDISEYNKEDSRLAKQLEHQNFEEDNVEKRSKQRISSAKPEDDKLLQEMLHPIGKTVEQLYLSPLKRELYKKAIQTGGYDQNKVITLDDGRKFKLKLSKRELEFLEPSLYVQSYRIKSSIKKAVLVLRMLRGMNVSDAVTQCHFNRKNVSRDIGTMLQRGLDDAKAMGMDIKGLYIDQLWVGSDGEWQKQLDPKARGRVGIIEHPYVHVKAILKTKETKTRIAQEKIKKLESTKPKVPLPSKKISQFSGPFYKW
ncbi:ribosomal protein L22 [Nadsonia fulvescens var. elongata DSM 6958]|uniref:Ribosomal protein L22 n=1 Tax=Nadsonia fulvescens var. elongata DSM 6958 TaxID=857566 RepID=A0A1E3PLN6_9ASCO|nr:ribosomal protein L22 [Nadsonia fulvescens var. elongata DSM 6958]